MKPAAFSYHRPTTMAEALGALAELGEDGKVLAGGQSLVPMMSMRIAQPDALVDINFVGDFPQLEVDNNAVRVGALVRQGELERSPAAATACPLLGQALSHVSHAAIRNRGTVVGSLAHADPASELSTVLLLLGGSVAAASTAGTREIAASDLFTGLYQTTLRPDELVVSARFPRINGGARTAFLEVARRHGDFALCAVGALVEGASARVAIAGLEGVPCVLDVSEAFGSGGERVIDEKIGALGARSDIHASGDFRRHLASTLVRRALTAARNGEEERE